MNSYLFQENYSSIKESLTSVDVQLNNHLDDFEIKGERFKQMDEKIDKLILGESYPIQLQVGWKLFTVNSNTLLQIKDSLLSKMILQEKFNFKEVIFIERCPKFFPFILEFYKFNNLILNGFNEQSLIMLLSESEYFEVN